MNTVIKEMSILFVNNFGTAALIDTNLNCRNTFYSEVFTISQQNGMGVCVSEVLIRTGDIQCKYSGQCSPIWSICAQ